MKVFVSEKDKDFIDACLSETNCYLYIQDELQGEILKLKSLDQHDAEVRKQVIAELEEWADENLTKLIKRGYFLHNNLRGLRLVEYEDLKQKLNEMKGEER